MPTFIALTCLVFIVAYLLGSLLTAVILCKLMRLPDPRITGSKNPGATNVMRNAGKKVAFITLLGDLLKGLLAVWAARFIAVDNDQPFTPAAAALGAFLGHLYPLFFRFRGGKGVATAVGTLLGLSWITGLLAMATWLAISLSCRISSVAALITFTLVPFYMWWLGSELIIIHTLCCVSLLLFWRHRDNIGNLFSGTEPRVG